jgi:predicted nucleic acid-binding protein
MQKKEKSFGDTFFLDTNVLLDYLEKRHKEVYSVISELLKLNREGKITVVTSIFNVAELLEKELEIAFYRRCMKRKKSCDEIIRMARSRGVSYERALERGRGKLWEKVRKLIEDNEILLLFLPDYVDPFEMVFDLAINRFLSSQDLIVVTTAFAYSITYFLSNDKQLVKKLGEYGWFYVFNLREDKQRETFCNTVLKVVQS